jgi:hypothetical protein
LEDYFVSPVATGKVFVFNTTNQQVGLILNGNPLPDDASDAANYGRGLARAADGNGSYMPSRLAIPRSNATSINDPVFAQQNTLQVSFQGVINNYQINVSLAPPSGSSATYSPSNNDLLLYIFYGYVILVDSVNNALLFNNQSS